MSYIQGQDRHQQGLFPESLDDYIDAANPVRFLDVFVNGLDLKTLNQATQHWHTGSTRKRAISMFP